MKKPSAKLILVWTILALSTGFAEPGLAEVNLNIGIGVPPVVIPAPPAVVLIPTTYVWAFLARYRGYQTCPAFGGGRLRPEALQVRLGGLSIRDLGELSVGAARRFLAGLVFSPAEEKVASRVLGEVDRRLSFLEQVGLTT